MVKRIVLYLILAVVVFVLVIAVDCFLPKSLTIKELEDYAGNKIRTSMSDKNPGSYGTFFIKSVDLIEIEHGKKYEGVVKIGEQFNYSARPRPTIIYTADVNLLLGKSSDGETKILTSWKIIDVSKE